MRAEVLTRLVEFFVTWWTRDHGPSRVEMVVIFAVAKDGGHYPRFWVSNIKRHERLKIDLFVCLFVRYLKKPLEVTSVGNPLYSGKESMDQTNGHAANRGTGPPSNARGRFRNMRYIVVIQNCVTFVIREGGRGIPVKCYGFLISSQLYWTGFYSLILSNLLWFLGCL